MSRLLETLPGGTKLLETCGTKCNGFFSVFEDILYLWFNLYFDRLAFVESGTAQVIGRMKFIDEVMSDLGCHFYMLPYDTLLEYLLDLCRKSGVQIRFQVQVASVQLRPEARPVVVTVLGEHIEADGLVGADGQNSLVRNAIPLHEAEEEPDIDDGTSDGSSLSLPPNLHEIIGGTCSIPVSALQDDPEVMELVDSNEVCDIVQSPADNRLHPTVHHLAGGSFFGERPSMCGNLYIISIVRTDGSKESDIESDWCPNDLILNVNDARILEEQEPRVIRLLGHAKQCHRTIQRMPKIARLADPATGVVIIGDAAHTIHCTHNASIAAEDGFALGRAFSHLTSREEIPFLLNGYHQVRYKRSAATEASELAGVVASTFPPGPARDARNQQFKAMSLVDGETEMADEVIAARWATYLVQFNYDANEAVDEWWLTWGKLVVGQSR
ncbi:hypothetical protein C8R43DRAFT_1138550 [Mycena crocata]|nr:hypothetical protein C8R43DRAFT_1138550 [Mycena crocata]